MKRHFVIDENVIVFAFTGTDEFGNRDLSCASLMASIADNCHALVLHNTFPGAYLRRINGLSLERTPGFTVLIRTLMLLLSDMNKDTRQLHDDDLPPIEGLDTLRGVDVEEGEGVGDDVFVRAAAAVPDSILVTADRPLSEAVRARGIDGQHGFRILHPREVVELAGPDIDP